MGIEDLAKQATDMAAGAVNKAKETLASEERWIPTVSPATAPGRNLKSAGKPLRRFSRPVPRGA